MEQDTELIDRILQGDRNAFDKLIRKYQSACIQKVKRLVKDSNVAHELVQSAYIKAYFCLSNLKDKTLFKFWLLGIVENTVKEYWRKTQQNYLSLETYADYLSEQDENKDWQHMVETIVTAIKTLPESYQNIVNLFYYDGLRIKEIAEITTMTEETVKVRLHRARKILKKMLQMHEELHHYHQNLNNTSLMKKIRIADIIISRSNKDYCSILLQDEDNTTVFPMVISTDEATTMVMALKNIEMPRPFVFNLVATLMKTNQLYMESVCIHDLVDGIFISTLKLRKGKQWQELDARPSDAMTLALMFDSPVYISQKILDTVGFPIPEKYKNVNSREKGIENLVEVIENWKKSFIPARTKIKTEPEIKQAIDKLLAFTFDDE